MQVTETCTSDEDKLSYLLESLQDSGASSVVKQCISNGDTFNDVAERLKMRYDKPREVFLQALKTFTRSSPLDNKNHSFNSLVTDVRKAADTLKRYGDGTTTQLLIGLLELQREWVRHHKTPDSVPSLFSLLELRSSMKPLKPMILINTNHVICCHCTANLSHLLILVC